MYELEERAMGVVQMKTRSISGAILLLLTGCGFTHQLPLYSDYQSIRLNQPVPAKYDQSDTTSISRLTDWEYATGADESFGIIVNDAGDVVGKKYQMSGEEGSLLTMMFKRREKTEWEIDIKASTQEKVYQALRSKINQLQFVGSKRDWEGLLQSAEARGDIADRSFRYQVVKDVKLFPAIRSTCWMLYWEKPNILKIAIEERIDISPVVWTVLGWGYWLVTGKIN